MKFNSKHPAKYFILSFCNRPSDAGDRLLFKAGGRFAVEHAKRCVVQISYHKNRVCRTANKKASESGCGSVRSRKISVRPVAYAALRHMPGKRSTPPDKPEQSNVDFPDGHPISRVPFFSRRNRSRLMHGTNFLPMASQPAKAARVPGHRLLKKGVFQSISEEKAEKSCVIPCIFLLNMLYCLYEC